MFKATWGGKDWDVKVLKSARPESGSYTSVLVTGAAGFFGSHVSAALKCRGDGVVGLDVFNNYYDPTLKRSREKLLLEAGVFVVEGDINDDQLLKKLFDLVAFTHVMHLAAQAGARYMQWKIQCLMCIATLQGSQMMLLQAIEEFCGKTNSAATKEVGLVLKALYDADLVEEDYIQTGANKDKPVWSNAKPFAEWLQSAESESEDE